MIRGLQRGGSTPLLLFTIILDITCEKTIYIRSNNAPKLSPRYRPGQVTSWFYRHARRDGQEFRQPGFVPGRYLHAYIRNRLG
jgi:hypothetical protein